MKNITRHEMNNSIVSIVRFFKKKDYSDFKKI